MWNYTYPSYEQSEDELCHYGVKGMRWGVHRATKQLSKATNTAQRDKAIAKLEKHRSKATAEIAKLDKKRPKLERDVEKKVIKNETKAATLSNKAAKTRMSAYGKFTSKDKAAKRLYEADKLQARADSLKASSEKAKSKLAQNETMRKAFETGIKDIDKTIAEAGKRKFEDVANERVPKKA